MLPDMSVNFKDFAVETLFVAAISLWQRACLFKAHLNGFNICLNMHSTQLLNQMSEAFEQVVQNC